MPISRPYLNQGSSGTDQSMPGVLVQKVMPTLGYANSPSDPVNIAAQGVYSFVRHLNSGSRNYDPTDLMIYIGAYDSIYYMISWMSRLYATICSYSQGNRFLPRILIEAQGVNFQDLADNMPSFRMKLNQRIAKASQLMIPKVMPIFDRHRWMFANYYIEGDTMKDQIYMYSPIGFYKFTLDSDGAGMLKAVNLREYNASPLTLSNLMQMLDDMLDPIIQDEDFNIMSGDIYKAYQGNIVTYTLLPDLLAMNFAYDEGVLLQFKNAKGRGVELDSSRHFLNDFFDVTQDSTKSYLIVNNNADAVRGYSDVFVGFIGVDSGSLPLVKDAARLSSRVWTKPVLLTSPHSDVDAAENMINTRGTMAAEVTMGTDGGSDSFKFYYGSEWYGPFELYLYTRSRSTRNVSVVKQTLEYSSIIIINTADTAANISAFLGQLVDVLSSLTKFKYHPEVFITEMVVDANNQADNLDYGTSCFEVDNYSVIDYNVIKGMHDAALLGEYNVPRIALLPT